MVLTPGFVINHLLLFTSYEPSLSAPKSEIGVQRRRINVGQDTRRPVETRLLHLSSLYSTHIPNPSPPENNVRLRQARPSPKLPNRPTTAPSRLIPLIRRHRLWVVHHVPLGCKVTADSYLLRHAAIYAKNANTEESMAPALA